MATGQDIVNAGNVWVREKVPYVWGGVTKFGADCSGYVQSVLAEVGIKVGRTTYDQINNGIPVENLAHAQPGDLLFFGSNPSAPTHVGIYVGNGQMIDEPHSGAVARQENVWKNLVAIRRVANQQSDAVSTPYLGGNGTTTTTAGDNTQKVVSLGALGDVNVPTSGLVRLGLLIAGVTFVVIALHALTSNATTPVGVVAHGSKQAAKRVRK